WCPVCQIGDQMTWKKGLWIHQVESGQLRCPSGPSQPLGSAQEGNGGPSKAEKAEAARRADDGAKDVDGEMMPPASQEQLVLTGYAKESKAVDIEGRKEESG